MVRRVLSNLALATSFASLLCALAVAVAVGDASSAAAGSSAPAAGSSAPVAGSSPIQPTTGRRAARTLTITPGTGLVNQVVTVSWTGFKPTSGFDRQVIILQCKAAPTSLDDCYTKQAFPHVDNGNQVTTAVTGSAGTGSAFFEVRSASVLPELNCKEGNPCALLAYENDGNVPPPGQLPATAVTVPIEFARSNADCPPVVNFDVRGEGEPSAGPSLFGWAGQLCTAASPLIVDYTATASPNGRESFLGGAVDYGVTSMPATDEELAAFPAHPPFTYAPVALSAVVVVSNVKDAVTQERITDITLTPKLLAKLITYTDQGLTFFSDPEFAALNPGHTFPFAGVSQPLLRGERNADTYLVTDWLQHDAATRAFLDSEVVNPPYKGIEYPTDVFQNVAQDTGYITSSGEADVALRAFYGVKPGQRVAQSTDQLGLFGIVDLPTAVRFNLPVVKLVNAAGQAVLPDEDGLSAGLAAMTTNPDGVTRSPNYATTDPKAYPLVKVDYAMVSTEVADAMKQAKVKALLQYIAGDGQHALALGAHAMPDSLLTQTRAAIDRVAVATTTTTAPTTTAAPTTTTTRPSATATTRSVTATTRAAPRITTTIATITTTSSTEAETTTTETPTTSQVPTTSTTGGEPVVADPPTTVPAPSQVTVERSGAGPALPSLLVLGVASGCVGVITRRPELRERIVHLFGRLRRGSS